MYFLVLLDERPDGAAPAVEHEPFIDSLIERRLVLLGGELDGQVPASAAYVVRCDSLDEARELVATDPLVRSGAATASVSAWDLVGVDTRVIDPRLLVDGSGTASGRRPARRPPGRT